MSISLHNYNLSDNSHTPYYVQIKYYLRQLTEQMEPNTKIPGEVELAEKFHVSRGTVKQAIMDLVYEGLLYRKQGKGTFTSAYIQRYYSSLPSFTKDIRKTGRNPKTEQLGFKLTNAAPRAQLFFRLSSIDSVYRYKRLILDGDTPVAVVISFLNPRIFSNLSLIDIGPSLYESLYKKYGATPTQATDLYSIADISPKTAQLLNQPRGTIVIYSERKASLSDGSPCEFVESYIRKDYFKIQVDFHSESDNTVRWTLT